MFARVGRVFSGIASFVRTLVLVLLFGAVDHGLLAPSLVGAVLPNLGRRLKNHVTMRARIHLAMSDPRFALQGGAGPLTMGAPTVLMGKTSIVGQEVTPLSGPESAIYDVEFDETCDRYADEDGQISDGFRKNKGSYLWAIAQAKSTFSNQAFAGLEPVSGNYGWRLMIPQDISAGTYPTFNPLGAAVSDVHTWYHQITLTASHTRGQVFPVTGSGSVIVCSTINAQSIHAFHEFISYRPGTRIQAMAITVNGQVYTWWALDGNAKTGKPFKSFRLLPLSWDKNPDGMIVYTGNGGNWSLMGGFDKEDVAFATQLIITEEIGVLGIVIAQYNYLATQLE